MKKQPRLFSFLLVAFPLGLIISIVIAIWIYYVDLQEGFVVEEGFAIRPAVNEKVLGSYVKNLRELQESDVEVVEEAIGNYLTSTLGKRNLGFEVEQEDFSLPSGGEGIAYLIDVPGEMKDREPLTIFASYGPEKDGGLIDSATATAAALCLLQRFDRDPPRLPLRFVFASHWFSEKLPAPKQALSSWFTVEGAVVWILNLSLVADGREGSEGVQLHLVGSGLRETSQLELTEKRSAWSWKFDWSQREEYLSMTFYVENEDLPPGAEKGSDDIPRMWLALQELERFMRHWMALENSN